MRTSIPSALGSRRSLPFLVVCLTCLAQVGATGGVTLLARVEHPPLAEISGMSRSSFEGLFWVHNDSGDGARLFAIGLDGKPVIPPRLALEYAENPYPGITVDDAWNNDWEDIALDAGTIYIADMGNNFNARRDLGVYVVPEPDPRETDRVRASKFLPLRYPDQTAHPAVDWHFDCEAMFVDGGRLYFLTKHRGAGKRSLVSGTKLYRLDTDTTDRDNVLTRISASQDLNRPTAAELSPSGDRLAILTRDGIRLFRRPARGDDWLSAPLGGVDLDRKQMKGGEAVAWKDANTILVATESRKLFAIDVSSVGAVEPPAP